MSLHFVNSLISPPFVAAAGVAVLAGLPFAEAAAASGASLALLKGVNTAAFAANCAAVSVPGRIDETQDADMRRGALNPAKPGTAGSTADSGPTTNTPLVGRTSEYSEIYSPGRGRTLVSPSGWAFSIWAPIYLGEAAFVASQFWSAPVANILPQVAPAFVAANIFQCFWCASFRPSYNEGWRKYVSVGMLAGTAYSLSHVHAVACSAEAASLAWYFLPMSLHFGWTTAATLVNLNGSVAMNDTTSDSTVIAVGHGSAIAAAALGVGITLARDAPAYGFTVAWALAAVADGMTKRIVAMPPTDGGSALKKGAGIQKMLCWAGSAACVAASVAALI